MIEAQRRGYPLFVYSAHDLQLRSGSTSANFSAPAVVVKARSVRLQREVGNHVHFGDYVLLDLSSTDVILMRQDPPFDMGYLTATYMLGSVCWGAMMGQETMRYIPRLYIPCDKSNNWGEGRTLSLTKESRHYLTTVMRCKSGDSVRVFNNITGEWHAEVVKNVRHREAYLILGAKQRSVVHEPGPILLLSCIKRDATDLVVRMATELGVRKIQFISTQNSVANPPNFTRLTGIAQEAAEQCERLTIPEILPIIKVSDLEKIWTSSHPLFVAFERTNQTESLSVYPEYGLMIGPEGGFTAQERDWLTGIDFVYPISLGPNLLRADTAAVAGLSRLNLLMARKKAKESVSVRI